MQEFFSQIDQINPLWIIPFTIYAIGALLVAYDLWITKPIDEEQKEGEEYNKKKERITLGNDILNAVFRKEIIVFISCLFLISCTQTAKMKHHQRIHGISQSGTYHLKTLKSDTATFKRVAGEYIVHSDTIVKRIK